MEFSDFHRFVAIYCNKRKPFYLGEGDLLFGNFFFLVANVRVRRRRDVCQESGRKQKQGNYIPWHTVEQGAQHVEYQLQNLLKDGQTSDKEENDLNNQQHL